MRDRPVTTALSAMLASAVPASGAPSAGLDRFGGVVRSTRDGVIITEPEVPRRIDMRERSWVNTLDFGAGDDQRHVTPCITAPATRVATSAIRSPAAAPATSRATVISRRPLEERLARQPVPLPMRPVAPRAPDAPSMADPDYRAARLAELATRARRRAGLD